MRLSTLLKNSNVFGGKTPGRLDTDPEITSVVNGSDRVMPGALFVAITGAVVDGHDYVTDAVTRGAVAIVAQHDIKAGVPVIETPDTRRALGLLASAFYGNPSRNMTLIGLCGTNGKTTTAFLLEHILLSAGYATGLIGTVAYRLGGKNFTAGLTTPDSDELQNILSRMRDAGASYVVMEVSSHGIAQERIAGCSFGVGVYTNLTQDHLDFHGDMESYWAVKKSFFTKHLAMSPTPCAVINTDDPRGNALVREIGREIAHVRVITVGVNPDARVRARNVNFSGTETRGEIIFPNGGFSFDTGLVGRFNLENILCACGAALALGLGSEEMRAGIDGFGQVPGRLETISDKSDRRVYVDFAHTPAALENLLSTLSELSSGRIICVFGCGGDRDRSKRRIMGRIAGEKADLCIVTSDNPRTENPDRIIEEIVSGFHGLSRTYYDPSDLESGFEQKGYTVVPDRTRAIGVAVRASGPRDTIVIAGKGHETYQIIGKEKRPFDDRDVARKALGLEAER